MGQTSENEHDVKLDDAYRQLKAFLAFYNDNHRDMSFLPPDLRPSHLLEKLEKENPKRAVSNVRTEVHRIVSESLRWGADKIAKCESALKEKGLVSLSELQMYFSNRIKEITKRGKMENIEEYRMVKRLVEGTPSVPTRKEMEKLEAMMSAFEEVEGGKV
jgi:hypothetical protein